MGEGDDAIDDGTEQPLLGEGTGGAVLGVTPHGGTEQRPLMPEEAAEVEARRGTAGGAADDEPPSAGEGAGGALPGGLADVVDHDGAPGPRGRRFHRGDDVFARVVDRDFGAERPGEGELDGGGAGGDDARAEVGRDLDRRLGHATAGAPDEYPLPAPDLCARDEHAPRGEGDE